ncbi:uncharacterized protein N7484_009493 [Penicillium longicatenatum]|uniref:uncharacterized protein n=1 Tax=Penicillium longicatenatum TaxID=1561947 RepID=UPI0025496B72|nr:uncharacterized protein N7484_009493 [Penicillium longicatenatum]KAJ5636180.1 hypothetical protein N7484_009493 [Penicillium longicatenatum]
MTFAAFEKIKDMRTQVYVRDPANFDMHTKEDHAGYGVMQVVQNLIIDFERAGRMEGNWKDQWALCEAMAMFHLSGSAETLNHVDDGESVKSVWKLISFMFLSMLIALENEGLLGPKSKVKNLGMIMALFLQLMKKERPSDGKNFEIYVFAFAILHQVELIGLPKSTFDMLREEFLRNPDILPGAVSDSDSDSESDSNSDSEYPWVVKDALDDYMEQEAPRSVGGDDLDITAWTSAERERYHFGGQDPLSEETISALEKGDILTFGS